MAEAPQLTDLLHRWRLLRQQGETVSAEQLCTDCPELLEECQRRVEALAAMESFLGEGTQGADTVAERPVSPKPARSFPTVPGYEVIEELGRGGMGVVYKAWQVSLDRPVALKMILAGLGAGEEEFARFRREAEVLARLQHPNIVQIYEVGEHGGHPFCLLEFVNGGTLAGRLGGTPQPPRHAAALVRTLALAMDAAHRRGIVHRDLKPGNILLAVDGRPVTTRPRSSPEAVPLATDDGLLSAIPKITDFGLAKRLDEDTGQTRTGMVMGTPAYMAPEQAAGRKEVGPLADVYALGAILYEVLTGRPPFKAATVLETLEQVRTRDPVPVRLLQPKVPRALETVCLKCLDKDPHKRYASAEELAQDLDRWLAGKLVLARRSTAWERGYRWACRNPVVAALSVLVALAFLGGFAGVAWQWRQTQAALDRAQANLYFQRISLADREIQTNNGDGAEVLLDLCPPQLRHWEWYYLKRRCHADWLRFEGHTDLVRGLAYSHDGKRLASCGNDRTVRIWDAASGRQLLTLRGHASWVNAVAFPTEGRRLVSAGEDGTVKVWDARDGRELASMADGTQDLVHGVLSADGRLYAVLQGEGLTVYDVQTGHRGVTVRGRLSAKSCGVAFSPDGYRVAAPLDGGLGIWDSRTGQRIHLLDQALPLGVYSLAFSPDGQRLFAGHHGDRYPALHVWDATTGQKVPDSMSTPLTIYAIALSPDGRSIATGGLEGIVKVRDTVTSKNLHTMRAFDSAIVSLAFRPDGRGLAAAVGCNVWQKDWGEKNDQGPTVLESHAAGETSVAFSPDGARLAVGGEGNEVQVREARTGKPVLALSAPAAGYLGVGFSPDGRRLLATGRDGAVYTWEAAHGRPGPALRVPNSKLTEAAFSPDGRHVATGGSDRAVRVWDGVTGQEVLTCTGHEAGVSGVCFSPDGRSLASAGHDGTVRLWDATTGREVRTLRGHQSYVQSVSFQPGGRLLASASTDETVRLWDAASGREVATLQGHTGPVRGLSFSPDGRRLASASEDGTARLWDVATGQEALGLPHPGKVRGVIFSPDGWRVATASSDGSVRIWNATPVAD